MSPVSSVRTRGALAAFAALVASLTHAALLDGAPIWCANSTSKFAFLRSDFTVRAAPSSATVYFAALGSPRPPAGTTQAKLLGAAAIYINGILVTAGPGHNVPTASQVIRGADIAPFLVVGPNAIGVTAFFDNSYASGVNDVPRVQAVIVINDATGSYNVSATGNSTWTAHEGDSYFNPTGDAGISWYPMPNEYLDRRVFPLRWAEAGFGPSTWTAAVVQPPWSYPLYYESGAPPTTLIRRACNVTVINATRQVLDFGQEFMGGVNLTFHGATPGSVVTVTLAEVLRPDGTGVLSPATTGNRWASQWTLTGNASLDAGVHHHEFVQFRYAQVDGAPGVFTPGSADAAAWVIQHPAGGDGRNPFEIPCATSTPAADAYGAGASVRTPLASWRSSSAALDAVWAFAAYTIVATSLDVNVDGQTRERDVDVVDALNTELGQFYVFSPGDSSIQRRTLLEMQTNDTGMWSQWLDFKTSTVLNVHDYILHTGDVNISALLWSDDDYSILADADTSYNSLQFEACLRYFNASGNGLLHFPSDGSCGGSWACDPLVDWPSGTRDGYDCGTDNTDDTVRSSLGAMAYSALSDIATWLGKTAAAARYANMAATVTASLRALNVRYNATAGAAYFVDGAVGKPASHVAVHSTLYATAAGAADGNATLGDALTVYLTDHGVAPSSCMMGRWWVNALMRLGVYSASAADAALAVLTAEAYPSWLNMLAQGATCTMEAWRPQDKGNLDWAHPWCASPSFTIPSTVLGATPLTRGWGSWQLAPQTSDVTFIEAQVPTPYGMLAITYNGAINATTANATVSFTVLLFQTTRVCLCVPGTAAAAAPFNSPSSDVLLVDGVPVSPSSWGRFLCTDIGTSGQHVVTRATNA